MPVGLGCQRVAGRRIVAEGLRLSLGETEIPVQEYMCLLIKEEVGFGLLCFLIALCLVWQNR
jgi:hypothetical protein